MTDHVPTLDRCKRLKELGMPQETKFSWHFHNDHESYHGDYWHIGNRGDCFGEEFAAPLATEILEWLPKALELRRWPLLIMINDGKYVVGYGNELCTYDKNLPNALADLLTWCVEHGHVRFEERKP